MTRPPPFATIVAALIAGPMATSVLGAPTGRIGTLTTGTYACELPGDAAGAVGRRMPDDDFVVINASTYRARDANGTYLVTGRQVIMTSGPLRGQRYRRVSDRRLQAVSRDGVDLPLRCIRAPRADD